MQLADVFGFLLALVHQVCQPEPGDVEKIRQFFCIARRPDRSHRLNRLHPIMQEAVNRVSAAWLSWGQQQMLLSIGNYLSSLPLYLSGVFRWSQSHHSENKSEFIAATLNRSAGRRGG